MQERFWKEPGKIQEGVKKDLGKYIENVRKKSENGHKRVRK